MGDQILRGKKQSNSVRDLAKEGEEGNGSVFLEVGFLTIGRLATTLVLFQLNKVQPDEMHNFKDVG